jgi:hypothetical protein
MFFHEPSEAVQAHHNGKKFHGEASWAYTAIPHHAPWSRLERGRGALPREPGNWWVSSSSLRSRFSPPPPRSRSFSLSPRPPAPHRDRRLKAIVPPRISPPPPHPPANSLAALSSRGRGGLPASSHPPRYTRHAAPPSSLSSPPSNPVQSTPSRLADAAKSVWGAIGLLGDPDSSRGFVGPDATGVEGLPFLSRLPTGVRVCG